MLLSEDIANNIANLSLWILMWVTVEHMRQISEAVGWWGQSKARGKKKGKSKRKKTTKESQSKKPTLAELEAMVRQMFPERPTESERSRVRAAVVEGLKQSARGVFDLLPAEKCVSILKRIAGAGRGCPRCQGKNIKEGKKKRYRKYYQRCICLDCKKKKKKHTFYELTGTVFEGSHLTAKQWLWGMYLFVGGCSTREMAIELDVNLKTAQRMVSLLQLSLLTLRYRFMLRGKVEFDEVYIIGGLKGQAGKLALERAPRKRGYRCPGRGNWDSDKVPILGLVDRQGHIYLVPCANVQSETIQPLIEYLTDKGATIYTDEYNIYNFLLRVGYQHQTVNHSKKEYARGQVHVNTVEGLWSLLRDHLRIHRGVSKLYLPLYVMRFEFLTNRRNQRRWYQMLDLCELASLADGVRLRHLVRERQVHTACPILGLGQTV